jgi:hypothetical protein
MKSFVSFKIFNQERQIIELQNLNEELSKRLKTVHFDSVQGKMKSYACDNCDDYVHFSENSQVDNQSFNDYMNLFKVSLLLTMAWVISQDFKIIFSE